MTEVPADLLLPPAVGPAEFARRLLAERDVATVRGPLARKKTKGVPPRIAALKDMAVRSSVGWLARQGGWQMRAVVAGGRRREGRVWASGIWESLGFAFSPAALELLARGAVASSQPAGLDLHRLESALAGLAPETTGDIILFHVALEPLVDAALARERASRVAALPPDEPPPAADATKARGASAKKAEEKKPTAKAKDEKAADEKKAADKKSDRRPPASDPAQDEARVRALVRLSPLTALFRADELDAPASPEVQANANTNASAADVAARAAAAKLFAPLVKGDRALLLTYLDDALAKRWIAREVSRRAAPIDLAASARFAGFAGALEGLAGAAIAAGRPDALRPIARYFERSLVKFGQREAVCRDLRERVHAAFSLASERAAALARIARLFEVPRLLESAADRILDTTFVDRSEPEKVFVSEYQDRLRPVRPELEAIRRELAGEVG